MPDPVAESLSKLYNRDAAAVEAFRAAALTALSRFPSLASQQDRILSSALDRALAAQAEFRSLEDSGRRQALRAAVAAVFAREFGDPRVTTPGQALYARLESLSPNAKKLAILTFVKRESFVEVIQQLNLNGAALAAEITELRRIVNIDAKTPQAADFPAYSRVPFLVSGHLEPDDALRVREYLGQSEACRTAYRDLDTLERGLARLGPAAGEPHPDPDEWIALADDKPLTAERRDVLAEHARLCRGCAALAAESRSTAERGASIDALRKLDSPANRKKAALAAALLSFAIPALALYLTRDRIRNFEFGVQGGVDIGSPLAEDPGRSAFPWNDAAPILRVKVDAEPGIAYDLRLESATEGDVVNYGDAPVRSLGAGRGEITLTLRGAPLPKGEYRLHLLRRMRGAGGEPMDLVYPIVVR